MFSLVRVYIYICTLYVCSPCVHTSLCTHVYCSLCVAVCQVRVKDSEESIAEHETFHESLLNVEKWLMIMRQKLESYQSPSGEWSVDNREQEAQVASALH